jgi:Membrane protein involved in the export of O-antigen and teichoic acid
MLAIFSKPSTIFFRRHVLGPGLKLLVVLLLILFGLNVYFLSVGFVIAGALGVILYTGILLRDLHSQGFWKHFKRQDIRFPIKEVYSFSTPLLTRNLLYLMRGQLIVVLLEYFHKAQAVADYRAVQPVADLNTVVLQSFSLLFMPAMARLFAKNDQEGINNLYWQSTIWVTIITFPVFLVTFSLAQPVTLLLFGQRYAESGLIMALLAFGYYFNAALGYNVDTLQVYGKLRYMVTVDFVTMLICLVLSLLLIPKYAAIGAAVSACVTLVLYNILNHLGLKFATQSDLFRPRYLKVYVSIALGAVGLLIFEYLVSIPLMISIILAGLISLVVLVVNRNILEIEQTFPELLKFQVVRFLFKTKPAKT